MNVNLARFGILCFGFGGIFLIWSLVSVETLIPIKLLSGFFAFILLGLGLYLIILDALNNVNINEKKNPS